MRALILGPALMFVIGVAITACGGTGAGPTQVAGGADASATADPPAPSPDPTKASVTTAPRTPSPPPSPTFEPVPSELAGTWAFDSFGRAWTITLDADGSFDLYQAGALDMSGSFGVRGDMIEFTDKQPGPAGGFCGRLVYTYTWQLVDGRLQLEMVDDDCVDGWARGATGGLTRVP